VTRNFPAIPVSASQSIPRSAKADGRWRETRIADVACRNRQLASLDVREVERRYPLQQFEMKISPKYKGF